MIKVQQKLNRDSRLQTEKITSELIDYIVKKIVRVLSPNQIILFGSHARGDAADDSDLDLFVVHDTHQSNRDVRRQIETILWGRRFDLDLIVRHPSEVAQNIMDSNPFYLQHLFGEGKILYERPS